MPQPSRSAPLSRHPVCSRTPSRVSCTAQASSLSRPHRDQPPVLPLLPSADASLCSCCHCCALPRSTLSSSNPRYIQGARLINNPSSTVIAPVDENQGTAELVANSTENKSVSVSPTLRARFVGQGYKQVCGKADVWGDGVVPEESAHLEGALNISLEGVYHSPVGSDDNERPWYGSPNVVEKWVHHLLS